MQPQSITELFEAAAAAFAALRLFHFGLHKTQKAMVGFLLGTSAYLFALGSMSPSSRAYFWTYIFTDILGWGLGMFAVREIFTLALANYPGLRTTARRTMYAVVGLAGTLSFILAGFSWNDGAVHQTHLFYVQTVDRSVVLTLAAFTALALFLLSRYPLHLQRNTVVSCAFFCAVFLLEAGAMLIDSYSPGLYSQAFDTAQNLLAGCAFAAWAALLRPFEESAVRSGESKPREAALLRELDLLNGLVSRASRQ